MADGMDSSLEVSVCYVGSQSKYVVNGQQKNVISHIVVSTIGSYSFHNFHQSTLLRLMLDSALL